MAQLQVRRWRKGRHDRLYISTDRGIKIGWYDLRTQRHHLDVPGMWPQFQQEVARWRAAHPGGAGRSPGDRSANPHQPSTSRADRTGSAAGPDRQGTARHDLDGAVDATDDLARRAAGHNVAAMAERLAPRRRSLRVLARLLGVRTRDRSWRIGAAGERAVGAHLDPLVRRGWRVLHAIDLGLGGDIDHLLIGPFGVFTVNTKHHPGAVVRVGDQVMWVRGRQQPYVGKSCREAARVRQALSATLGRPVHVAPLVVVHGHRRLQGWVSRRPQGVQVLPSWAIGWWCRLPGHTNLTDDEVDQLYATARRRQTWRNA